MIFFFKVVSTKFEVGRFYSCLIQNLMNDIFMDLRFAVFENEDDTLAQIILASTINIVRDGGSKNKILMKSVLDKIFVETCDDLNTSCPFTTPGFHMSFRLIKEAMWLLKEDTNLVNKGKNCTLMTLVTLMTLITDDSDDEEQNKAIDMSRGKSLLESLVTTFLPD